MSDVAGIYERIRKEANQYKHLIEADNANNCVIVNKSLILDIPLGDNIMILEDQFKSGYDCKACNGTGEIIGPCLKCDGRGNLNNGSLDTRDKCGKCNGTGAKTSTCIACNGKGALIEIPEEHRARPTSGTIVAKGPNVKVLDLGQRVAYSTYTGHLLPFKGNNRLRIMREVEPFCRIREIEGTKEIAEAIEFVDKDEAYNVNV